MFCMTSQRLLNVVVRLEGRVVLSMEHLNLHINQPCCGCILQTIANYKIFITSMA